MNSIIGQSSAAISTMNEDVVVPRLMLYGIKELAIPRHEIHRLVLQTVAEALAGRHAHHFYEHRSRFSSLCAALTCVMTEQREGKRDASA